MNTKSLFTVCIVLFIATVSVSSQTGSNNVVDLILSSYTARALSDKPVSDDEIQQIIECGIKAPSARNKQPWRFTVVKDMALLQNIIHDVNLGNVLIVVSGPDDMERAASVAFDCALATENMYLAAQGLGLGSHIYTGPVRNVNENLKEKLEIPQGYRAISVLRIGTLDSSVDAVSSASPRNPVRDVVNYK